MPLLLALSSLTLIGWRMPKKTLHFANQIKYLCQPKIVQLVPIANQSHAKQKCDRLRCADFPKPTLCRASPVSVPMLIYIVRSLAEFIVPTIRIALCSNQISANQFSLMCQPNFPRCANQFPPLCDRLAWVQYAERNRFCHERPNHCHPLD